MNDRNEILQNQPLKLLCILCQFIIKYIKIKSRISKLYAFFHKKNAHCYLIPHSFANVLYLSTCMLGNFYCRLLTFFKIIFLQKKTTGTTIRVSKSLDTDQDRHSVVFFWVQTVCERLLADDTIPRWHAKSYNRFNILSHIGRLSNQLYMYIYTISIRTL